MPRFVALFRGINVGKAKRIAMADLRELLGALGYSDVRTLLNSGNAVFEAKAEPSARHAQRIQTAVLDQLGVDTLVIVKSATEIAAVVKGNKLHKVASNPSRLLVAVTKDAKSLTALKAIAKSDWGDEQVHLGKQAAYLWCENGILESNAAVAMLKNLADAGTTRNWATIQKLHALLQGDG